jgi:hypothetical protein
MSIYKQLHSILALQHCDDIREIQDSNCALAPSNGNCQITRREWLSATFVWHPAKGNRLGLRALPRDPSTLHIPDEGSDRAVRMMSDGFI